MTRWFLLVTVIFQIAGCASPEQSQTQPISDDQLNCSELIVEIERARENSQISRSDNLTTFFRRKNCPLDSASGDIIQTTETTGPEMQELNRLFGRGLISEEEYNEAVEQLNR